VFVVEQFDQLRVQVFVRIFNVGLGHIPRPATLVLAIPNHGRDHSALLLVLVKVWTVFGRAWGSGQAQP